MKQIVYFITHANVTIDPAVPVTQWGLSAMGRARHSAFNQIAAGLNIATVFSSAEQKAIDGATIMAKYLGISVAIVDPLHENDRTATGYLPPVEFEKTADKFFQSPNESIRGWETAADAQQRIVAATESIRNSSDPDGNIAIVSHGAVGALLLCHLSGVPITRDMDQPCTGGGNYFAFHGETATVLHAWESIA